ncbi:peptidase T [Clostridium novyi A str. 4552]|uniref:Peptidase T n=1 Tax=Clostridium novyi A str. 4552 TaxID=1444289 RepID=A0A0A0I3L8_CLONO|nr:peptidase T [Clostridium novyi]KGM94250.1 peptidase T [Clostridium novyi A str. 4552]
MEAVVNKFLKYISFDTKSNEDSNTHPSTEGQMVLAKELAKELKKMGMIEVSVDSKAYVMATLPANTEDHVPVIGFVAHMDTAPDMSGKDIKPKFIEDYDGNDIVLNEENNIVLKVEDFPEIKEYVGKTLITTDGTTLLGADDKAGVAEIMTAMEYLINHPEIKHGTVKIAFTPDEEIGAGADYFDVEKFNADFAYTVDGGAIGELECENFNAAGVKLTIHGRNVHPGSAKNKMINSISIASELASMLPDNEVPEHTEGYEGFYHIVGFNGTVEETKMQYIIRDFDRIKFEERKATMKNIVNALNEKYGKNTVILDMNDQYYNMKEKVEPVYHIVDTAFKAMEEVGVVPKVVPIRGGTDGARLSFMGLPTPNLFTGGHNFHGKFEFIPTFAMSKAVDVILKIIELYSK